MLETKPDLLLMLDALPQWVRVAMAESGLASNLIQELVREIMADAWDEGVMAARLDVLGRHNPYRS